VAIPVLFATRQADIGLTREVVGAIRVVITLPWIQGITLSSAAAAMEGRLAIGDIVARCFALSGLTRIPTGTITVGCTHIGAQLFAGTSAAIVTLVTIPVLFATRQTYVGFTCEVVGTIHIVVALPWIQGITLSSAAAAMKGRLAVRSVVT